MPSERQLGGCERKKGERVLKVYPFMSFEIFNHMKLLCLNTQLTLKQCGVGVGVLISGAIENPHIIFDSTKLN